MARALIAAAKLMEEGRLEAMKADRYRSWNDPLGQSITAGESTLADLAERVESSEIAPVPRSGRQELYENVVDEALWSSATSTTSVTTGVPAGTNDADEHSRTSGVEGC